MQKYVYKNILISSMGNVDKYQKAMKKYHIITVIANEAKHKNQAVGGNSGKIFVNYVAFSISSNWLCTFEFLFYTLR